jgi:K+/H+ antiporter YhaU regulatory subunit KhtT
VFPESRERIREGDVLVLSGTSEAVSQARVLLEG